MSYWPPQDLAEAAAVVQSLAAVAGLALGAAAVRRWHLQAQGQRQEQSSQVVIHNYPPTPEFGPEDVGTRR